MKSHSLETTSSTDASRNAKTRKPVDRLILMLNTKREQTFLKLLTARKMLRKRRRMSRKKTLRRLKILINSKLKFLSKYRRLKVL
jgi:hypothetical protein